MEEVNTDATPDNLSKNRKLFHRYLVIFIIIFSISGSFTIGYSRGQKSAVGEKVSIPLTQVIIDKNTPGDKNVDFSLFWKVWDDLKEKYVNKNSLDAQKLVYGAINGMLKATGDPYTTFFDPGETKSFNQDIEGIFEGIGAELGIKEGILTVIAPLDDSPAAKAGLRSGDKILKIGDKSSADIRIDEAVNLIRGKKGTTVTLTILHLNEQQTKEVIIIRDTITVKSVKLEFKPDNIAYVKINKFGDETGSEFNVATNSIIVKGSKGIILDLRNNPGGLLDQSVEVASRLIPRGKVVVMEENYTGKRENLYTQGGDKLSAIPMVVLINEGSASASEILAGALRDNQDITLIGKKSFGKGSVQEYIKLPQNTSVKITVAKWLTPNGDSIMEKGIDPDIDVELSLEDFNANRDPQLDKATEVLRGMMK